MRLRNLTASAHAAGGRIDLSWENPDFVRLPGARVVRRERTFPTGPDDGVVVRDAFGITSVSDTGLRGETVHYYAVFPFAEPAGGPARTSRTR
ncbi:hypothetical protein [Paractinoplanes durhamensis]|uniref:hypothetical protein n=1 Tax=Paractinoplanes durhamensis TaxID=113563 RepID=UPI0036399069